MNEHNIDGHIIHVNSVLGHRIPDSFPLNVYPATKRAVGALAEVLRFELNDLKSNIKITVILLLFNINISNLQISLY